MTGATAIEQWRGEFAAQGIAFTIARRRGAFKTMLVRTGLAARIGDAYLFQSVRSAVQAYWAQAGEATASYRPSGR